MSDTQPTIVHPARPVARPGAAAWNSWGSAALFVACISWLFFPAGLRTRELTSFAALMSPATAAVALAFAVVALYFVFRRRQEPVRAILAAVLAICPMVGYALRLFWGLF